MHQNFLENTVYTKFTWGIVCLCELHRFEYQRHILVAQLVQHLTRYSWGLGSINQSINQSMRVIRTPHISLNLCRQKWGGGGLG